MSITIQDILQLLEENAPSSYAESYDNVGLMVGNAESEVKGVLCVLDVTSEVMEEALSKRVNTIVAHHPLIFKPLKGLTGKSETERLVAKAIKYDLHIVAWHTNLDHAPYGVSHKMGSKLGLHDMKILAPLKAQMKKLTVFVPSTHQQSVTESLHRAGAGRLGNYSDCSFRTVGKGYFKPNAEAQPFVGMSHTLEEVTETKVEVMYESHLEKKILQALFQSHPYEEVAHFIHSLDNAHPHAGSGVIGLLPSPMHAAEFLQLLKQCFATHTIRHTYWQKPISKVALCGGAGGFLISRAIGAQADCFITADLKYHDFMDAQGALLLADIGHFESEQYTIQLFYDIISKKFPNIATLSSGINTNPVLYT